MDLISLFTNWFFIPDHNFGMVMGLVGAITLALGSIIIWLIPKYKWLTAGLLLAIITPLGIGGFWLSAGHLGISDWDYYASYHYNIRKSVIEYGVFPEWNPYTCGGTSAIGDPEFPLLTLTFLPELLFGVPNAFSLAIFISIIATGWGALFLSKQLRFSVHAGLLSAIILMFGSVSLLEIVEGHPNVFSAMWLPWVFATWLMAYRKTADTKNLLLQLSLEMIACSVFLSLMFYAGGIYLLMYTALAFLGLFAVVKRRMPAIGMTIIIGVIALGLSALKLIPVFFWLSEFQDTAYASSAYTLPYLHQILLGRYLHTVQEIIPNQGGGWHEYGAYIGPTVLILASIGLLANIKNRLVLSLALGALTAILISSTGPFLKPFFDTASFLPRSNISRFILFAVIPISFLAGYGLNKIKSAGRPAILICIFLLFITGADLMTVSFPLSEQAFVLNYPAKQVSPAPSPIAYIAFDYKTRYQGVDYTRAFSATKAGYGTLNYCSVLTPPIAIATIHDEVDNGIVVVKNDTEHGTYDLVSWNPNKVVVNVTAPEDARIILNTNYAKGWFVNGRPSKEMSNRVGAFIPEGEQTITFQYKAPGFRIGILISILTITLLITWGIKIQKNTQGKR